MSLTSIATTIENKFWKETIIAWIKYVEIQNNCKARDVALNPIWNSYL